MKLLLTCPKQFAHLVSAMLHIGPDYNKKSVMADLLLGYAGQVSEPDPVVWIRNRVEKSLIYPKGIYVRKTFTVRTYQELKPG